MEYRGTFMFVGGRVVVYIAEVRSIEPRSIAAAAAARRVSVNSKFNFDTEHNEMLLYIAAGCRVGELVPGWVGTRPTKIHSH